MQPVRAARRRGLDRRLIGLDEHIGELPHLGWIRAVRDALGMSTFQLASRMGITSRRVLQMERGEANGAIQLSTLKRAAEALNCRVFYVLVPQQPLNAFVRRQAREVAVAEYTSGTHANRLDGESVDEDELSELIEARAYELIDTPQLWRSNPLPHGNQRDQRC